MLLAAAMAAMMVIGVGAAFASHNPGHNPGGGGGTLPAGCTFTGGGGGGTTTCVTKTVDETTEFEVTD
jgi:hypothetical protein